MESPTTTAASQPQELPKSYRPIDHEQGVWERWMAARAFHAEPAHTKALGGSREPYCVLIPPPNVTAKLHLGHALNNTLQDVLVRAHRMMGFETLWMPGTDHAGIATQAVVEKRLRSSGELKGALRQSMTREAFVAKTQEFKDEYEAEITNQLKRMGCSCDYDRQRFTMDDQCAAAVREAFFRLFKDGLIYRGKRLVNWDCVLQTAVADDETYDEEVDGQFYYLRYPLVRAGAKVPNGKSANGKAEQGKEEDAVPVTWDELARRGYPGAEELPGEQAAWLTVATTRPETYLGDTAVAINPHDPRAKSLRGLFVELPLVGRVIPVIEDSYVVLPEKYARNDEEKNDPKAKMATGFLKVTPAHDPNDYEIGRRHSLPIINMLAPDGTVSDKHGWTDVGDAHMFVGRPREHARKMVVKEFDARGLLEGTKPTKHSLKHSDRSSSIVEPYLSDQWYVRVTDERMAKAANEVLAEDQKSGKQASGTRHRASADAGTVRFFPARYAKTYEQWHDGIRDWCISRQLWWGHRIPVWSRRIDFTTAGAFEGFESAWNKLLSSDVDEMGIDDCNCVARFVDIHNGDTFHPTANSDDLRAFVNGRTVDAYVCIRRDDWNVGFIEHLETWGELRRDPDVLDTWFSSGLWPLSTMGWPDPAKFNAASNKGLLEAFNPTSSLSTAREIITLWVSRMVMFNGYFRNSAEVPECRSAEVKGTAHSGTLGPPPFRDVFIHCVIQDGQGQKMSKSLGNGVDPLDIIETHGADALRFTLCHMATQTQDVRMSLETICPHTGAVFTPKMITVSGGYVVPAPIQTSPKDPTKKMVTVYGVVSGEANPTPEMPLAKNTSAKFDLGRNFATKLWNAARLVFMSLGAPSGKAGPAKAVAFADLSLLDQWMITRLERTRARIGTSLTNYEFSEYAQATYDLVWRDFCDWYLEGIKPTIAESPAQRAVLANALDMILRLLHPAMPFVTETIWTELRRLQTLHGLPRVEGISISDNAESSPLLCLAPWPLQGRTPDFALEGRFDAIRSLVGVIRDVRAKHQVKPSRKILLHASAVAGGSVPLDNAEVARLVCTFAGLERIATGTAETPGSVAFMFDSREYRVSNLVDAAAAAEAAAAGGGTDAERARLTKLVADLSKSIDTLKGRLANPGYAERAPAAMVQQTKDQLTKAEADVAAAKAALEKLGS